MTSETRDIGILFGDVAGSTRLYEVLGDRAAMTAIETCLQLMSEAVAEHGGLVVKTIGDEIMAALPSPTATCDAAVSMQKKIDALPPVKGPHGETRLCLRVGFHFGPAIAENGDYFGDTVNLSARMVGIARAGQIITTGEMLGRLSPVQRSSTRDLDRLPVRGKAEEIRVVEVIWQQAEELTRYFSARPSTDGAARPRLLKLKDGRREWVFDNAFVSIALGREPGSDVLVSDHQASRRHATIERRRDKWVLIDHSTNGTFVTFAGEPEMGLRREEIVLRQAGQISFGHPANEGESTEVVTFTLV